MVWGTLGSELESILIHYFNLTSYINTVCFNTEGIGCFSNEAPFSNAGYLLPQSPEEIGVSFHLYTRRNQNESLMVSKNETDIGWLLMFFNGRNPTKFIIHGYRDNAREPWVINMKNEFLKNDDVNVLIVDWSRGANTVDYNQAAANSRVVGALVAQIIQTLVEMFDMELSDVHLIGHSVGAHIAGYAGNICAGGLSRITGLDPAGPSFSGEHRLVRLDSTDAAYVDVIHTDTAADNSWLTFGAEVDERLGDADYYPNGGNNQPGCGWDYVCDHNRARDYFIESINSPCRFEAVPCAYLMYKLGYCSGCGEESGCTQMGYHSENGQGSYFLNTNAILQIVRKAACLKFFFWIRVVRIL